MCCYISSAGAPAMLIDCPHCARAYHIVRGSLGANGRKMRCAGCREVWHAVSKARVTDDYDDIRLRTPDAALEDLMLSGPEITTIATSARATAPSYDEIYGTRSILAKPPRAPWRMPRPPAGFFVCVLAMAGIMGMLAGRQLIVRHLPGSAPLYAAIGLKVNLRGLELRHVSSTVLGEGPQKVLAIEGEIVNVSRSEANVPPLALSLLSADGREIYGWTTPAPKSKLALGDTMPFRARLAAPPDQGREVAVRFAADVVKVREARQ